MDHVCNKAEDISVIKEDVATLKNDISNIKQDRINEQSWKERIEDKLDKILWFFLGQSVTLILTVVGGVVLYAITKAW